MKKAMKATAFAAMLSFSSTFVVAPVHAAIVSTPDAYAAAQAVDRTELKAYFDREEVVKALEMQGVTVADAKARVDAMTDYEAQQLAAHIETAPAGAGIVGTLFAVFVILLVTDILGLTKVFPFTRSVR